ncbi:MAG: PAS domain-containing protein [Arcobacteraceae bacterium]|nr:PAS domain-containing protein [Arcobacteraceae bacterium]
MNNSPLLKIIIPNILIVIFVFSVFYSIYQFLNYQSKEMIEAKQYVKQIEYDLSMMNTNLYQSYISKQMSYLVLSAKNSQSIKSSLDILDSIGYDTSKIYHSYLDLFKLSVQASSLFIENNELEALKVLDMVRTDYEDISFFLQQIILELDSSQEDIIDKINILIFVSSLFLILIVSFNIKYFIQIYKELLEYTKKIQDRAVLLDSIADGVYGVDKDGNCMFINQTALEMLGFSADEVLLKNQHELFHHHKPSGEHYDVSECPIYNTVNDRKIRKCEEVFIKKDGTFFPVSLTVAPTSDGDAVAVFRDISFIKEYELNLELEVENKTKELHTLNINLEEKVVQEVEKNRQKDVLLQHQSRLAAIGEMMGNIAHQWRQPLSAITSSVSGLKLKHEYGILEPQDIIEANDCVMHNAEFLSHTIDNFRNFFRKDQPKRKFFVIDAINDTISIIKASYDSHFIKIDTKLDASIYYYGSDNLLSQVILNILANSKDAFIQNNIENKRVSIFLIEENNNIKITITDNAGGISEDIKDKIFDPYFTTKHQSQGTGLGLYMSSQIIHNHFHGKIFEQNIENEESFGASFVIEFPQIDHCDNFIIE